ncbi:MAG: response regulator, partial [Bdellovibrionales bacterium]|nr:response regulator [Bdellovibrionales bacterium]
IERLAMNNKILLVEDSEFFRAALKSTLESNNYEVLEAPNGKAARDIIPTISPDLILSDIQMPHFNGVELLKWTKENHPTKFMLMTGFSHILETQNAFELGADEFIAKPFDEEDLIDKINNLLRDSTRENNTDVPLEEKIKYCKVSLEDFVSDKAINLDIFIQLKPGKFLKIAHKGGKLDDERIENYKSKGLKELYIRQEDFAKVLDFNIKLSKLVAHSSSIPIEKKERFLLHTAEVILEKTFVDGVDKVIFDNAKDFLTTSIDLLAKDDQTFTLLEALNNHTDYLYAHCLGVSMYSVMIAKKMKWSSTANLFKLAFSGLMHDIGKKEIDPDLLLKSRPELTFKERQMIETHAMRGKLILESLKSAPSEAVAVAFEHHEDILGQGYPRQIGKNEIHPMAKIVHVANEFCNYTIKGPHHPPVSGDKALSLLDNLKRESLDHVAFRALKEIFSSIGLQ